MLYCDCWLGARFANTFLLLYRIDIMTTKQKLVVSNEVVSNEVVSVADAILAMYPPVAVVTVSLASNEMASKLEHARNDVVESVIRGYGAERAYAILLNEAFAFDWFAIEHTDTSDNAKALAPEKKLFMKALNVAKHTNPSTVWARVRKYGNEERNGKASPVETVDGVEVEKLEQGDSGENNQRSPMLRNIEELTALYKFNNKQESLDQKIVDAHKHIVMALECLGVNLSLIG
jgi:hypothetical protein